ncbi:MAG: lipocalin-like domain-containing protein [Candidatus Hydrogenedentes bacterium]|nr:lipocalin-like domain-containing protein [Candidatus Hydrogenedentota bacterium]
MGRFEKWGGWLAALVVALAAIGLVGAVRGDVDSDREPAEADQRIAAQEGSPGAADEPGDVAARFEGHWRLLSFENFAEDGTVSARAMTGRILYDGRGNMSAQLMPQGEDLEGENRRTRGYVAYFGRYEIDAERGIVTHRPEGSTIFPWVGRELVRYYSFSEGNLELSLKNGERVTGTLTWERIE